MTGNVITQCCDECGREMVKAHRIRKGHRYCATCYSRVFKRRMCLKCGNFARLPKDDPTAVCRKCENNKPCIRCGKVDYVIGKITPYGPVCNACAPHFRKPEPCEVCGALSPRLTRVSRLGHDHRVCPTCAGADHSTCMACFHHRRLLKSPDGRMLCKACLAKGEIPCPKCQELMPAGHGAQCRRCYWTDLLKKRIRIDCAAFSSPRMAAHFETFGTWLWQKVGEKKAALTINRYLPFFMDIERQWRAIPDYGALLGHFGAAKLRQVLLPMRWMEITGFAVPDGAAKLNDSEQRRIVATLNKINNGLKERTILEGYYTALMKNIKANKTTVRSIRLALSPAAALLLTAREMERMPPDQCVLDAYLAKTPGQRAAVSGFVRYLRDTCGAKIFLPATDSKKMQQQRQKKLEAEMLALMAEGEKDKEFRHRWLSVALAYFHGLPRLAGKRVLNENVFPSDGGMIVIWHNRQYWLPLP